MALTKELLVRIAPHLKDGYKVASFGYPDIISPLWYVESLLGEKFRDLSYRQDSDDICGRHRIEQRKIPDAESFFSLMGCALTVFDIVSERGCENILDLNEPLPLGKPLQFDIVLDIGTLEHVFHIGQAALNMASMVKYGGFIFHENPYNMGNHGFYGMNPTWYADFYRQPGFKLLVLEMVVKNDPAEGSYVGGLHGTRRFEYIKSESNMIAVAQRTALVPIRWPQQTKYKKSIATQVAPDAEVAGEIREVVNG